MERTPDACERQENGIGRTGSDAPTQPPGGVWYESSRRGSDGTCAIATRSTLASCCEVEARSVVPADGGPQEWSGEATETAWAQGQPGEPRARGPFLRQQSQSGRP